MSPALIAHAIDVVANILLILLFVWVVLTWIAPPYNLLRETLERMVEPLLRPIRRVLPAAGPMDFSPMVLMLLIIVATRILDFVILSL